MIGIRFEDGPVCRSSNSLRFDFFVVCFMKAPFNNSEAVGLKQKKIINCTPHYGEVTSFESHDSGTGQLQKNESPE